MRSANVRTLLFLVAAGYSLSTSVYAQSAAKKAKQPKEVIEAYRVCNRFQETLTRELNFDRAYEATFTKSPARRREIAVADGELGNLDLTEVDTATLVSTYKSRMQILLFLLPLLFGSETNQERALFFPPMLEEIVDRKPPKTADRFTLYADQLQQDAITIRFHVERIAGEHPGLAELVRKMKEEWRPLEPSQNFVTKPLTAYSRGHVLGVKEPYYQIGNCAVVREDGEMRLIGFKFFDLRF